MPVLTQHVGDHDGRQVHVLVGVGGYQAVRRQAVAQGVISSFVVHQVQERRVGEIGRRYGWDFIVLVILVLTIVCLKHKKKTFCNVSLPCCSSKLKRLFVQETRKHIPVKTFWV